MICMVYVAVALRKGTTQLNDDALKVCERSRYPKVHQQVTAGRTSMRSELLITWRPFDELVELDAP